MHTYARMCRTMTCSTCWVAPCLCDARAEVLVETVRGLKADVAYNARLDLILVLDVKDAVSAELMLELMQYRLPLARRTDVEILY